MSTTQLTRQTRHKSILLLVLGLTFSVSPSGPAWSQSYPSAQPPATVPVPQPSPTVTSEWKFSGHFLIRSELDGRDFSGATPPLLFTSLRTRLTAEKDLLDGIHGLIQLEDSRIFGDSGAAVANFKNIDLHQGFLEFAQPWQLPVNVQVGRFEMGYCNQRLISPVFKWNWIGRAFDGLRLKYKSPKLPFLKIDGFATMVNASARNVTTASPEAYVLPSPPDLGNGFYGLWANLALMPEAELDIFGYFEDNRKQTKPGFSDVRRLTTGISHRGQYGIFSSSAEVAFQKGAVSDTEVTAWMGAARGFAQLGEVQVGAGADFLSGNPANSTATSNTFASPFGDGHHFYGYMDYFNDIPTNTKGRGLHDYFIRAKWQPTGSPFAFQGDLHHFTANQADAHGNWIFGQEADLTVDYQFGPQTLLTWGLNAFKPGELMTSAAFFGNTRQDIAYWSYISVLQSF